MTHRERNSMKRGVQVEASAPGQSRTKRRAIVSVEESKDDAGGFESAGETCFACSVLSAGAEETSYEPTHETLARAALRFRSGLGAKVHTAPTERQLLHSPCADPPSHLCFRDLHRTQACDPRCCFLSG